MEELEYCDDEAIKFILNYLPAEMQKTTSEEDIEYILDFVYDYYDEKDFLDDDEDMIEIDEDEIFNYVIDKILKDNKSEKYPEAVVGEILQGEYEYCRSIGVFEDEE